MNNMVEVEVSPEFYKAIKELADKVGTTPDELVSLMLKVYFE